MRVWKIVALVWALSGLLSEARAQGGPIELGQVCGDNGRSNEKSIEKALRAANNKDYPTANVHIGAALRWEEQDQHALYLQGEVALRMRKMQHVEASWKRLVQRCPSYKPDLLFYLGTMILESGRPEEAERYLEQWLARDDREYGYDPEAEAMLKEIRIKETLLANPVPFEPRSVKQLNTPFDEYLGALTPDGSTLYFTRRSKKRNKYEGPAAPLRSVEEFSLAVRTGSTPVGLPIFDRGDALEAPFNQEFNEGGPTLTADNSYMVVTVCEQNPKTGAQNCDLYFSRFEFGAWSDLRPLPEGINTPNAWESQPSISPNGDVLYFASDRSGGFGGLDIYQSVRLPGGKWGPVQNLGPAINTRNNEKSPFIHMDSESLYFASDGHPGLGGYDLFKSTLIDGGTAWSEPLNIGYPINTAGDEVGLSVTLDGTLAYFASNKINRANGWDIFFFELHEAVKPQDVVFVRGKVVRDAATSDPAEVVLRNARSGDEINLQVAEDDQSFAAVVKRGDAENTVVKVKASGASFSAAPVSALVEEKGEAAVVLEHRNLMAGVEYPIPHILFETASDQLARESSVLIAEFASFLTDNPRLHVELQGHTDNVGDASANLDLSRRRAKRVADELVNAGISRNRLTYQGFGERKPVATNDTAEGRAMNRRTVFLVKQL